MRIKFVFEKEKGLIKLPISYQQNLQAMIYKNLSDKISSFIHDEGFKYEKRRFKLFCFSRLFGRHKLDLINKNILFKGQISFYLSTPYSLLAEDFTENIVKMADVNIGRNRVYLTSVEVFTKRIVKDEIYVKMISPFTMYSTFKKDNGEKIVYYYTPFDKEFQELIRKNIIKKYIAFYGKRPDLEDFIIEPVLVSEKRNINVVFYKNFLIKAWDGIYKISGSRDLMEFSYNTGIGAKNSQGFGMWEEIEWRKNQKK